MYFEMMKNLCESCRMKTQLSVSDHTSQTEETETQKTLWDFPFLSYSSFGEMLSGLVDFVQQYHASDRFWSQRNEDGYSFTQWQIYYISKKFFRYKGIRGAVFNLFNALSKFSFFGALITLGTATDPLHHTVHHYLLHMECGMNTLQMKLYQFLVNWLVQHGYCDSLSRTDDRGMNVFDYFEKLFLPVQVVRQCRQLTETYKREEQCLFAMLPFLSKCEMCSSYINPYTELVQNSDRLFRFLDDQPDWSDRIYDMLSQRDQCNQLYAKHTSRQIDEKCVQRHDHVINVYRSLFEW